MTKCKLLVDGTSLSGTMKGVGKYTYHALSVLCESLPDNWQICVVICDRSFPVTPTLRRCIFLDVPRESEIGRGYFRYPGLLKKERPDVLFTANEVIVAKSNVPRVTVCHDINELIWHHQRLNPLSWRGLVNRIVQRFRVASLRRCDIVVCNSDFVRKELTHWYGIKQSKTRLGYCGIDDRIYSNEGANRASGPGPFGDGKGYILTFATGDPRENYHLLPAILEKVKGSGLSIRMVVAGMREPAAYAQKLRDEFSARGLRIGEDVAFLGFLGESEMPRLIRLYREADVYLELSGHEGFGMQLAEALASGLLCISSRGGALAEVGGEFVQLLRDINVSEIAARIVTAYVDGEVSKPRPKQIEFTRRYSWEHSGKVIADAIEELADRSS